MAIITLLTDFGLRDPYGAIMKGVILSINPQALIIDVTHEIEPQAIEEAAFVIEEYHPFFPEGTIHLAVVDPTVGSERRAILLDCSDCCFLGPDNGIFTLVMDRAREIYAIEDQSLMRDEVSSTFHGRDVFAPLAAHLASGVDPRKVGRIVSDPVILDGLLPGVERETLCGRIVRFDRFGNAITNIHRGRVAEFAGGGAFSVTLGDLLFPGVGKSYFEGKVTLFGSSGYLEFGLFMGDFRREYQIEKGMPVVVHLK